jgi:hypothetical protein
MQMELPQPRWARPTRHVGIVTSAFRISVSARICSARRRIGMETSAVRPQAAPASSPCCELTASYLKLKTLRGAVTRS